MVAIAVDRYLCICHPFTRLLTVHRAKLTIILLALCASAVGVCVSLMYGVHNQFPQIIEASANRTLQPEHNGTVTGNHRERWQDTAISCNGNNCSNHPSVLELYLLNTGVCHQHQLLLSGDFQRRFHYFYYSLFTACLLVVSVLYVLIYCSVLARRSRRHKQKTASLAAMNSMYRPATVFDLPQDNCEELVMTALKVPTETDARKTSSTGNIACKADEGQNIEKQNRSSVATSKLTLQERYRIANLKTAAMLFVVTAVFVITFLPASLISFRLVPYHIFVFYLYFVNNVANPFIYSFMNKNFRDQLRPLFCSKFGGSSCQFPREQNTATRSRTNARTARPCCVCCVVAETTEQQNDQH